MTRGRVQGLDLIRGMAILLVMLRHAWPGTFDGAGIVGVVMFFALSGYLITGLLLRDANDLGCVDYRRFYRNRALRLLPALVAMLAVFTVVEFIRGPVGGLGRLLASVAVGGLYLQDLLPFLSYPGINHLWTLAVEEQFYLLWPAALLFAFRRNRVTTLLGAAALAAVGITAALAVGVAELRSVDVIYPLPTTWAVALILGGAAYYFRERIETSLATVTGPAAAAGLVVLLLLSVVPDAKSRMATYIIGGALIAVCTVLLINLLVTWNTVPTWMAPLRRLGLISYGAYLWNGPMATWTEDMPTAMRWVSIVLTIAAAEVSWRFLEQHALRHKEHRSSQTALV